MTSSTASRGTPLPSISSFRPSRPNSEAGISFREPPKAPTAVRRAATITASCMVLLSAGPLGGPGGSEGSRIPVHGQPGGGGGQHLLDRDSLRHFLEKQAAGGHLDYRQVGDYQIHGFARGQGKGALRKDLG